jgi:hypothetical protein
MPFEFGNNYSLCGNNFLTNHQISGFFRQSVTMEVGTLLAA